MILFFFSALSSKQLDDCWEEFLLAAIGETLEDGEEVTGVRVVDKVKASLQLGYSSLSLSLSFYIFLINASCLVKLTTKS